MEYKDYYQTLGVARDADEKEIRRAYRKLARQYHPDVNPGNPGAEARFKEITEAYEVLSDPEKRKKYDQFGSAWRQYERAGNPGGFDWSRWTRAAPGGGYTQVSPEDLEAIFGAGGGGGFSSFFEALFGGMGQGRSAVRPTVRPATRTTRARKGQDMDYPVTISLTEAYAGTTRVLSKDGRRLEVDIPAGVSTGSRVRLPGEGAPGVGGAPAGDLYFVIEVAADPRFEREGDDLHTTVGVPLVAAMLGGEVTVDTLGGPLKMRIPPETPNGRTFRLTGKGMPKLRQPGQHGDLFVAAEVLLPTHLSDEERALFARLRELRGER